MSDLPLIRVRAVPGRLYPVLSGHPDSWLGWTECKPDEIPEHRIPAGKGPRDAPAMSTKIKHPITGIISTKTIPEVKTGREIRLKRVEFAVVHRTFDIARALSDGDLVLYQDPEVRPQTIDQGV